MRRRRRQTTDIPLATMHITAKRGVKKCMFRRVLKFAGLYLYDTEAE